MDGRDGRSMTLLEAIPGSVTISPATTGPLVEELTRELTGELQGDVPAVLIQRCLAAELMRFDGARVSTSLLTLVRAAAIGRILGLRLARADAGVPPVT
jgi:hypothetical protein